MYATPLGEFLAALPPLSEEQRQGLLTDSPLTSQGHTGQEVVYVVTTLSPQQACPRCLLRLIRHHWHIENGLHYVRDVTFGEDRSRLRVGHAPQVLAALRNLANTLIHRSGSFAMAASRRAFAYHPERALALLPPASSPL